MTEHPQGVDYQTAAILAEVDIAEGAQTLELKAYAGEQTWADEVVYADAKVKATGNFKTPADPDFGEFDEEEEPWTPVAKRMEVSNEHPLLMLPLYAHGPRYSEPERKYSFWGDDTLIGKWQSVPEELKPYTIVQLHPDDLAKRRGVLADFYVHYLEEAQNYVNPKTGQNEPIPVMLTVYTAGNLSQYTATHWITPEWIDEMYKKYSCLKGVFSTESYWVWQGNTVASAAKYLEVSAQNGGYFIWSEQNHSASIEKAMGVNDSANLRKALEKYSDYFIFIYKNTPQGTGNDAPTASYMKGLWLAGYINQWGGLMDTWKWYETGKWKLFASGNLQHHQPNRQWPMEPEAMLGMEAMMIYLNGGCVYNFEHPFYTYGVKDQPSPLYTNVIQEFFKYVIDNPAPSREEMLAKTKSILRINYSQKGNGNFFTGLNIELPQTAMYTTGRYGIIPAVPGTITRAKLQKAVGEEIEIIDQNAPELRNAEARKDYFNSKYEENYQGDIFAQKLDDRWFVYNYKYNQNVNQEGYGLAIPNTADEADKLWNAKITLEPHTFVILKGEKDKVSVKLNNYRVNKDELWEGAKNVQEAIRLRKVQKQEAVEWIASHYIQNTKDTEKRISTIELKNLEQKPVVRNLTGLTDRYDEPEVRYDADTKTATVTINNNGYVYFDLVVEAQPQPQQPLQPYVPTPEAPADVVTIADDNIALSAPQQDLVRELTKNIKSQEDKEAIRKWVGKQIDTHKLLNTISDKALQEYSKDVPAVFSDESESRWYAKELSVMRMLSLVKGYEDGRFHAEREITGEEFITILVRAAQLTTEKKDSEHWFAPYRRAAEKAGWLKEADFAFNRPVSREEIAVLSYAYLKRAGKELPKTNVKEIKDKQGINTQYMDKVVYLYSGEILKGYEDGTFRPQAKISRSEAVAILYRLLKAK